MERYFLLFLFISVCRTVESSEITKPFLDQDYDGIPDIYEAPGETYHGLPLYEWGARVQQTDIFIEIDYMDPFGSGEYDSGLVPTRESLHTVKEAIKSWSVKAQKNAKLIQPYRFMTDEQLYDYVSSGGYKRSVFLADFYKWFYSEFAKRSYPGGFPVEVHFDVGNLYHGNEGLSPEDFDLGGGSVVPWAESVGFRNIKRSPTAKLVKRDYYDKYMDESRKQIFYYMLFGTARAEGGAGEALRKNVISTVTLNDLNMQADTLVYRQSSIMLHEIGHNIGLKHGGSDHRNFKPFYFSAMNYYKIFHTTGYFSRYLNILSLVGEGLGYVSANCNRYVLKLGATWYPATFSTQHWPLIDERHIDERYSDEPDYVLFDRLGDNHALLEYLNDIESAPVYFPWENIDFDCDKSFSNNVAIDVNLDNKLTKLHSPNDWHYIYFYHHYVHDIEPGVGAVAEEFAVPPF